MYGHVFQGLQENNITDNTDNGSAGKTYGDSLIDPVYADIIGYQT